MKRKLGFILTTLLVALPSLGLPPDTFMRKVSILEAPDAPGNVSRERVATCMWLISQDLNIEQKSLPNVFVIHVTRKDADAAGVTENFVRFNNAAHADLHGYYEIWIVGEPKPIDYSVAMYNILENSSGIRKQPQERISIMRRVLRYLQATVSALGE